MLLGLIPGIKSRDGSGRISRVTSAGSEAGDFFSSNHGVGVVLSTSKPFLVVSVHIALPVTPL